VKHASSRFIAGLAVLVLCAAVTDVARAQTGKLTGVVTDAQTGQPLEGAQVLLQGTGLSALTVANGRFFIVNVPPATYTALARRIGYQSVEVRNVLVQIDVTRTIDVAMTQATTVLEPLRVTAETEPLVEPGITGSGSNIRAEEIRDLPVTSIQGVLSLQQGFLEVPQNTDIVSFTDTRRNALNPISIRGGRAGETLTLVDGVPINNFVFGGPAFDMTNEAVEQVDFQRGGFEPQYGNALSGIINIATREGGANLSGAFSYQTSAVGGALGSTADDLSGFNLYQGFMSGPVPGFSGKLRFMLAGRSQSGADRVLKFDDDIFRASSPRPGNNAPHPLDLFTGFRALGYDEIRDGIGKLTFYFQPTMKLNVTAVKYQRQRLPFDFDWMLTGYNALEATGILNIEDSLTIAGGNNTQRPTGTALYGDVVRGSIRADRTLYTARWDHTIGRWAYTLTAGRFDQERETCNFFQGVCLGSKFADVNFSGRFVAPISQAIHPTGGTDEFFGGENLKTTSGRIDIQGQATDHHALKLGGFYQRHDLRFEEFRNLGVNNVVVIPAFYQDKPWDGAVYLQDKIEYDFLTIKLGARFDFGQAGGLFFADARDPTNGTTAREVCDGQVASINGGQPFTDGPNSGFAACTNTRSLLDSAATLAQFDDFTQSRTRTQFSPRIGVSFPLTERSTVFFNFGRYSQNPLYNNLFQNTGIGSTAGEDGGNICPEDAVVPGTTSCHPIIFSDIYTVSFLGNPNLLIEKTTSYEMGFATELGDAFALQITAFSKDQFGLSGLRQGGRTPDGTRLFDVGATYGGQSQYNYFVIVNQDFQTVRGFEISLRRRLTNYWGFNINYTLTQATTNASAPDQEFQRTAEEGDPSNLQEIRSQLDQPHSFNASLNFRAGPQDNPFGIGILDAIVRNANASLTVQASSGLPYTPTLSFTGFGDQQLARNSGRGPGRFNMNTQVGKNFTLSNIRAGAFVRVSNLLNTRNCIQVFPSTGRCDGGTPDQSRDRQGNTVGEGTFSTYFNRPQFFTAGREINAGLRFDF